MLFWSIFLALFGTFGWFLIQEHDPVSILLCHPHQQEVLLLQEQVRTILSSNQTPNSILSLLNFFLLLFSHKICEHCYGRLASLLPLKPAKVPARVKCPQVKVIQYLKLKMFFNCTNYTSSLISGWLWLHESSVSKSGDWRDDPELWARGDNALIFNCQHLTPEIFDQCCSPKTGELQVLPRRLHGDWIAFHHGGARGEVCSQEHDEDNINCRKMIWSILYIIYHYYRYYTLKVRLSGSALPQFRVSI